MLLMEEGEEVLVMEADATQEHTWFMQVLPLPSSFLFFNLSFHRFYQFFTAFNVCNVSIVFVRFQ